MNEVTASEYGGQARSYHRSIDTRSPVTGSNRSVPNLPLPRVIEPVEPMRPNYRAETVLVCLFRLSLNWRTFSIGIIVLPHTVLRWGL